MGECEHEWVLMGAIDRLICRKCCLTAFEMTLQDELAAALTRAEVTEKALKAINDVRNDMCLSNKHTLIKIEDVLDTWLKMEGV